MKQTKIHKWYKVLDNQDATFPLIMVSIIVMYVIYCLTFSSYYTEYCYYNIDAYYVKYKDSCYTVHYIHRKYEMENKMRVPIKEIPDFSDKKYYIRCLEYKRSNMSLLPGLTGDQHKVELLSREVLKRE